MMKKLQPRIALVTRETRLDGMLRKFATRGQAKFKMQRMHVAALVQKGDLDAAADVQADDAVEDYDLLVEEDETYRSSVSRIYRDLDLGIPLQRLDRSILPAADFSQCSVVVVAGPDGLVANTAKYAAGVPIVGVNPDPDSIDGVLLPFQVSGVRDVVARVLKQQAITRPVTLAQALLHDGQRMLAFNDLFIGAQSHVSARYDLCLATRARSGVPTTVEETQSSSGVLVSTGAGTTGWMSSVYNMACGVAQWLDDAACPPERPSLTWEDRELLWAVREPFRTQTTGVSMVAGKLQEGDRLTISSQMPANGVIFSDGIEADFLPFNGGAIAEIGIAKEQAMLVVK